MMPRPAAFARATKSASTYLKQNSEIAGMFERKTSTAAPAGEMSSVDTLSPSLITTGASSASPTGSTNPAVEDAKRGGSVTCGSGPSVRGSVMTPVSAEAAATTDEQR